jgi:hypothetical protein
MFYGRESRLGELFAEYRACRGADATRGRLVFLHGPLRIGKTSVARRFALVLRRNPQLGAVPCYLKARPDEPWETFRARLAEQLFHDATVASFGRHQIPTELEPGDLEGILNSLCGSPSAPTVVLVVDEVHRLFRATSREPKKVPDLLAFRDFVEATPGLMVIWIGPTAATRFLPPDLTSVLMRSSQALPIGPFSLEEATSLLSGRNLAFTHTIHLDHKLARHIHRLTGGEPLWLSHLGQAMWLRTAQLRKRDVHFDQALLHRVKQDLLHNTDLFDVRVDPDRPEAHDSLVWRTAFALAQAHGSGTRPHHNLTVAELVERLDTADAELCAFQLGVVLDLLLDRGAARRLSTDPVRWQLAVPLLAEYLERQRP